MDGKFYHQQMKKEVLGLCKELKTSFKSDWPIVMEVMFPDKWTWLKQYRLLRKKNKNI